MFFWLCLLRREIRSEANGDIIICRYFLLVFSNLGKEQVNKLKALARLELTESFYRINCDRSRWGSAEVILPHMAAIIVYALSSLAKCQRNQGSPDINTG